MTYNTHSAYQEAWNKTKRAYLELIRKPQENVEKWYRYGSSSSCYFCDASQYLMGGCKNCPLSTIANYVRTHCGGDTFSEMLMAIKYKRGIIAAALKRYKVLRQAIKKAGLRV